MNQDSGSPIGRPSADTTGPLRIGPDCWLVGYRNSASMLQCNTYLRIVGNGEARRRICIDPGSQFDFPVIDANISALIGGLGEVDMFTLNHQDPDVVGNAPVFCRANPRAAMMVTEDVWRLVQHLNFQPGRIDFANVSKSRKLPMTTGVHWQAVATPFCHFRGAMAFYDPEIRTLFTGDLFGGINQLGRVHLYAEEQDWDGVAQFHQIYMPSREVLRYAVRQIRALDPPVEIIAPQHGHILVGDRVPQFLDRLHELLVGHDLLAVELDESYRQEYEQVVQELVAWSDDMIGGGEVAARLAPQASNDDLEQFVSVAGKDVVLKSEGYSVLAKVFARLSQGESAEFTNTMRNLVLSMCTSRAIPIPPIGIGVEAQPES